LSRRLIPAIEARSVRKVRKLLRRAKAPESMPQQNPTTKTPRLRRVVVRARAAA
jgi:hypothetical protein